MSKKLKLIGQHFGQWTVLKEMLSRNGMSYWLCECSCGEIQVVRGTALVQKKSSKCKICATKETGLIKQLDDFHVASGTVYQQYKRNAKTRKINFELTRDDIKNFMRQSCYYCGNPPNNQVTTFSGRTTELRAPVLYSGIDRVDNSKGYTVENCVPCCSICNQAKSNMSVEQFRNWIKRLYIKQYRRTTDLTPGQLIDLLFTTDYKCWWAQERLLDEKLSPAQRAEEARKAQEYNAKRTRLIRTIDYVLDFSEDTNTEKTYDTSSEKENYTYFVNETKDEV